MVQGTTRVPARLSLTPLTLLGDGCSVRSGCWATAARCDRVGLKVGWAGRAEREEGCVYSDFMTQSEGFSEPHLCRSFIIY